MAGSLQQVIIVAESEAAASLRLREHGYPPEIAAEIAVYLAQATDLSAHWPDLHAALTADGLRARFVELDEVPALLPELAGARATTLLWNMTDGIRFYRGSTVPAAARLLGLPHFGAPPVAQHICQDKFASLAMAAAAGLPCPPTMLLQGDEVLAEIGAMRAQGPYFVKPNTLGAKLGIFADSRCATLAQARTRAARIWQRYCDRAVVQPYLDGDDVRVSFLDTGGAFRAQLGIYRLAKDTAGETGGAFMTMRDNETLSGARDTEGARGGFGATRPAAFVPRLHDLRRDPAPRMACTVMAIEAAAEHLARVLDLSGIFSMDLRVDAAGRPHFLEFEVCPAVTIYDFQTYLRDVHSTGLGPALAKAFRVAHERRSGMAAA